MGDIPISREKLKQANKGILELSFKMRFDHWKMQESDHNWEMIRTSFLTGELFKITFKIDYIFGHFWIFILYTLNRYKTSWRPL